MPLRKTESKPPFQLNAEYLDEHASVGDGKSIIISFFTPSVIANLIHYYVVLVTDTSLASIVQMIQLNRKVAKHKKAFRSNSPERIPDNGTRYYPSEFYSLINSLS